MKRLLLFATILLVVALASAPAFAAVLYWDGCIASGAVSQNVTQGDGKWTAWSAYPDGWSASTTLSNQRNNTSPHNVPKAAYNSTTSQAAYAEIQFNLTAVGYWTVAATQGTASLGVGNIGVTTTGATGLPTTTNAFSTGNAWNNIGTMNATVTNPKIKFTEGGATTNRWYLDQIRLTSATPSYGSMNGPADGATSVALTGTNLTWTTGANTSFFDVWFGTEVGNLTKIGDHLGAGVNSLNLDGRLASSTKYYWVVGAGNVDVVISPTEWSFTTVPEPGSLLALGTGLLGLFGFIRRRRA